MAGGPAGAIAGGAGGLMGGVGNAIGTGMAGNIQYDYNTQMLDLQKQTQQRSWEAQNAQLAKTPASQVIPSYLGGPLSAKD
jgi:glutamate synthase domain-containing protein 3